MFSEGGDFKDIVVDSLEGGASAFAGIYLFDKFLAAPLEGAFKAAGKYALPLAGLAVDIALNYAGQHFGESGVLSDAARVAGYAAFGKSIATLIGDPTPVLGSGGSSKAENWGALGAHSLSYGAEVNY